MRYALLLLLALPAPSFSQPTIHSDNTVQVTGTGNVSTMPNLAVIDIWLGGEGETPDQASRALVTTRKAIVGQVGALLGGHLSVTDSNLVILPVRGPRCENASGYNAQPRLSQGECAVIGYLATSQATMRTSDVSNAGTAVGLASRLGARDARLSAYQLDDSRLAQRAAVADAVADAGRQASAIAAAARRLLGPAISIRDQNSYERVIVRAGLPGTVSSPPPPPPPVEINLSPQPIETTARVEVTYALLP